MPVEHSTTNSDILHNMGCPICVAESVMEKAGIDISDRDALPPGAGLGQLQQDLEAWMQRAEEKKRSLADLTEDERCAKSVEEHEKLVSFVLRASQQQPLQDHTCRRGQLHAHHHAFPGGASDLSGLRLTVGV
jgi:hypothetical protein